MGFRAWPGWVGLGGRVARRRVAAAGVGGFGDRVAVGALAAILGS